MRVVAIVVVVVAVLVLVTVNPITAYLATGFRGLAAFALLLDLWLLLTAVSAALYLWRRRVGYGRAMVGLAALLLPVMLVAEVGYVDHRLRHQADYLTSQIAQVYQDDPLLVYTMRAGATGHQELPGNFSADFTTDGLGRKRIDQQGGAARTIHVFGDAYTFGLGVTNRDTWLNLLADRLRGATNVLNYGVPGYSLEQMFLSLRRHAGQVAPDDLVLFTLASVDLERNLVGKAYVCRRLVEPQAKQRFPRLRGDHWIEQDLRAACNLLLDGVLANSPFPVGFGALYRAARRWRQLDAMIGYADQVFAAAAGLAEAREARFRVVFLVTPEECRRHAFTIDLSHLATAHESLLPYCPADPAAAAELEFPREPHEGHWNVPGNQWAAEALNDLLASQSRSTPDRLPADKEARAL